MAFDGRAVVAESELNRGDPFAQLRSQFIDLDDQARGIDATFVFQPAVLAGYLQTGVLHQIDDKVHRWLSGID